MISNDELNQKEQTELAEQFTQKVIDFRKIEQPGLGCDAPAISMLFEAKSQTRLKKNLPEQYLDLYSLNGPEDWRAFLALVKLQPKPFSAVFTVRLGEGHFTANQMHIDKDGEVLVLSLDSSPWYYSPKVFAQLLDDEFPGKMSYLAPELPENFFENYTFGERGKAAVKASMQTTWKDCRVFSAFYALLLSKPRYAMLAFEMKQHAKQDPACKSLWCYSRDKLPKEFFKSSQTVPELSGQLSIDERAQKFKNRIVNTKYSSINQTLFNRSGGSLIQAKFVENLPQVTITTTHDDIVTVTIKQRPINTDGVSDDATPKRGPARWWNQATVFQFKTNLGYADEPNTTWIKLSQQYPDLIVEFLDCGDFVMKGQKSDVRDACEFLMKSVRQNTYQLYKDGMSQPLGTIAALRSIVDQMKSFDENSSQVLNSNLAK